MKILLDRDLCLQAIKKLQQATGTAAEQETVLNTEFNISNIYDSNSRKDTNCAWTI